jgi:uracil-DNA glycosylase
MTDEQGFGSTAAQLILAVKKDSFMPPKRKAAAVAVKDDDESSEETVKVVAAKKKAPPKAKAAPKKPKTAAADDAATTAVPDVATTATTTAATATTAVSKGGQLSSLITAADWLRVPAIKAHLSSASWAALEKFVDAEYKSSAVFPPRHQIFAALNTTPLSAVKVVIIGQDPYFNPNQAMGLSFSIPRGVKLPPSLARIYKVLEKTVPTFKAPAHGDLTEWAQRGVLLLNACLTVESGKANSHAKAGWAPFTNLVIAAVAEQQPHVVFLSWGGFAQKLTKSIDRTKHLVIEDPHPSPMSGSAFNATSPFTQINQFLESKKIAPIDWSISA